MVRVDILLATYNGARFLPEQLSSLENQTHRNWRLIVRDDGSTDGSFDLVRDWAARTNRDLLIVEDGETRVGPTRSFARLLARSDAPYFAFCDQDDVWHANKIAQLLDEMRAGEAALGGDVPVLVHSDLAIVTEDLKQTGQNFWAQSRLSRVSTDLSDAGVPARKSLVLQNFVTGCTVLGNAALRRRSTPVPDRAHVHDWWVALVAAYLGEIRAIAEPLIDYRQHQSNTIGAKSWDPLAVTRRVLANPFRMYRKAGDTLDSLRSQAACFLARFDGELTASDRTAFDEFARQPDAGFVRRKGYMARHGVYPQTPLRRLIFFVMM